MITALDHVQLAAPPGSEDALRAYYAGVLGMTEIPRPPALAARGGCWFRAGPVQLHLGVQAGFRPAAKAHPGLRVTGIEAYAARLLAYGAGVTWDTDLPGHRRFFSHDPVGNRLEFLEPVDPSPNPRKGTYEDEHRVPYGTDAVIPSGPAKGFTIGPDLTRS